MIVIYRNGVPTVVTGWRAWLMMLGAALALVVIGGPRSRDRTDRLDGAAVRPAANDPVRADRYVVADSTIKSQQLNSSIWRVLRCRRRTSGILRRLLAYGVSDVRHCLGLFEQRLSQLNCLIGA